MPKISVIVPVYNSEKYIRKCLDSILNQTMQDFEIIVVDDGSEDESAKIIEEYVEKWNRKIKLIISNCNLGVGGARNIGVKNAVGDYISFIDADDYIEKDLYENLLPYIDEKIDLIKYKMKFINEKNETKKIEGPIFEKITGEEAFDKIYVMDKLMVSPCLYLYRRKFYKENKFEFLENTYHEDFGLIPLILIKAKSCVSLDEYGYLYFQTSNSIMRNDDSEKSLKKAYDLFIHYDNMCKKIQNEKYDSKIKEKVKNFYINAIILKVLEVDKKEQKKYIKEIKKRRLIQNIQPQNLKQYLKKIILKISVKLYLKIR